MAHINMERKLFKEWKRSMGLKIGKSLINWKKLIEKNFLVMLRLFRRGRKKREGPRGRRKS